MRSSVLALLLFLGSVPIFSQTNIAKILEGKIIAPGKDVTGVVVQNSTTQNAVITDLDGIFSIPVKEGDTLVFLAIQFKRKTLPVTQDIFKSNFIQVPMEDFVNELDEVEVRPYNLSGKLGEDLKTLQLEKDVSAEALGLPNADVKIITQSERKLYEAAGPKFNVGMILSPPLNPIINAITGRTKMLKNRVKIDKKYAQTQQVQNSFEHQFFTEVLRIPEEKIDDFMYFCEVDQHFQNMVNTKDQLRLWEYLKQKSIAYRKNNDLD